MAVHLTPDDLSPPTATRRVQAGQLRRVARGVVTDELEGALEDVVAGRLYELVARLIPGAVITDRSARAGGPVTNTEGTRVLFVAHPERRRDLILPGHLVSVRTGSGPVDDDLSFHHDDLHMASQARSLVDNARLSRTRSGGLARTLSIEELEEWVEQLAGLYSDDRFARLRVQVERTAALLGDTDLGEKMSAMMGAAQGTQRDVVVRSPALRARRDGIPVDRERLQLFGVLAERLRARAPSPMNVTERGESRRAMLPFFEAYFSNFIEGTEFDLDEAARIVFQGHVPAARPADAHDVLGTYRIVADETAMSTVPADAEELLAVLRDRHATIMEQRPGTNPGMFKQVVNRVGSRVFVAPEAVIGTLQAGWEQVRSLDDPFARAVTAMFVVAEVHPFDDGNGRVARIMMNAELVASGQSRIVVPTVYRNNYLSALRAMTANAHPDPLIATLAFAQEWTARMDWSSLADAQAALERTHALLDPSEAEEEGLRLLLP